MLKDGGLTELWRFNFFMVFQNIVSQRPQCIDINRKWYCPVLRTSGSHILPISPLLSFGMKKTGLLRLSPVLFSFRSSVIYLTFRVVPIFWITKRREIPETPSRVPCGPRNCCLFWSLVILTSRRPSPFSCPSY